MDNQIQNLINTPEITRLDLVGVRPWELRSHLDSFFDENSLRNLPNMFLNYRGIALFWGVMYPELIDFTHLEEFEILANIYLINQNGIILFYGLKFGKIIFENVAQQSNVYHTFTLNTHRIPLNDYLTGDTEQAACICNINMSIMGRYLYENDPVPSELPLITNLPVKGFIRNLEISQFF